MTFSSNLKIPWLFQDPVQFRSKFHDFSRNSRKFQNSRKSMNFPWPWQPCYDLDILALDLHAKNLSPYVCLFSRENGKTQTTSKQQNWNNPASAPFNILQPQIWHKKKTRCCLIIMNGQHKSIFSTITYFYNHLWRITWVGSHNQRTFTCHHFCF